MIIYKNWADFKTEVTNRVLQPQWYLHIQGDPKPNQYRIYGKDDIFVFQTYIDLGSADAPDFENNYKNIWNKKLDHRDPKGLKRFHTSPRPDNAVTYFAGAGDNGGIGNGNRLLYNLTSSDVSKTVELTYNEDVCIKDGIIRFENAPLGAYLDVEMINPPSTVVGAYARKIPLLGTGRIDINSEDYADISSTLKLKVTVYNADGTGEQDAAAAFKVCGLLEMYRTNTV